jgi:hypothetical protein
VVPSTRFELEGLGQELIGAEARLGVMGDRHDDELVHAVLGRERRQTLPDLLGRAGDRAAARVTDDGELVRRVGVGFRLLDRRIASGPARVEPD